MNTVQRFPADKQTQKHSCANLYKRIQIDDIDLKGKETKVPPSTGEIIDRS
jgi:hypothetical protein